MVFVPAWTDAFGYHSNEFTSTDFLSYKGAIPTVSNYKVVTSLALRMVPTIGDGVHATYYHRASARLKGSDFSLSRPNWRLWGNSEKFFPLNINPHGSNFSLGYVYVPGWMTDKVIQDCIIEAHDYSANLLEDAAQAKQTAATIGGIFRSIVQSFLHMRRGQFKAAFGVLAKYGNSPKAIANTWLMWYYGIRPLISTMEALASSYQDKVKTFTTKKKTSQEVSALEFISSSAQPSVDHIWGSGFQGAECGLTIAYDVSSNMRYFSSLGLSHSLWNDALVTAWALIPYSFVIDWILPVERYLRTLTWSADLKFQSGYVNRRLWCSAGFQKVRDIPYTTAATTGTWPKGRLEYMITQRTPYNHYVPPSGLSLKQSISPTQALNAIALMLQRR